LIFSRNAPLIEFCDFGFRLAQIARDFIGHDAIEVENLQFCLADFAAGGGCLRDQSTMLALKPRLFVLQNSDSRNRHGIFLVEIFNAFEIAPNEDDLLFLGETLGLEPLNLPPLMLDAGGKHFLSASKYFGCFGVLLCGLDVLERKRHDDRAIALRLQPRTAPIYLIELIGDDEEISACCCLTQPRPAPFK
jgi:hypothetical protein